MYITDLNSAMLLTYGFFPLTRPPTPLPVQLTIYTVRPAVPVRQRPGSVLLRRGLSAHSSLYP